MTEDRLTHLLTEATNLKPSSDLRNLVAALRPKSKAPWFALSGVTASLAVVAFLAIPRSLSAAELIQRAGIAMQANLTYRTEVERLSGGSWRKEASGLHAPGWALAEWMNGGFDLRTPTGTYRRNKADDSIVLTHGVDPLPGAKALESDPSPQALARLFVLKATHGKSKDSLPITAEEARVEGEKKVRDVIVWFGPDARNRFVLDLSTNLPVREEVELRKGGEWRADRRIRFYFPGPAAGSEAFTRALHHAKIIDADALNKIWQRRLLKVQQVLRLPDGKKLEVRDLRTLPNGDVLMLYTGTPHAPATLEGPNAEAYARCYFSPNIGFTARRAVTPILPAGKKLWGMWFVPLRGDIPSAGPLRLKLYLESDEFAERHAASEVLLRAPLQRESDPPYRDAIEAKAFDASNDFRRTSARISSLADRWLDAQGSLIPLHFASLVLDPYPSFYAPTLGMGGPIEPPGAVRHDPKAVAEAVSLIKGLLTRPKDRWLYLDEERAAPLLETLDRWAKGQK